MTHKLTILIVDDEDHLRRGLALCLEDAYHVLTASSGEEGLQILNTQPIDALLTDYNLLGPLRGDTFLCVLHEHFPKLKIAVITGDRSLTLTQLKPKGVRAILYKGEVEDLVEVCRKTIKQLIGPHQTTACSSSYGDMGTL